MVAFHGSGRNSIVPAERFADGVGVASIKGEHCIAQYAFIFLAELAVDDCRQLLATQVEDACEQSQNEHVFPPIPGGSTEGFDGSRGDRDSDEGESPVREIGLDLIGVVNADSAVTEGTDVVLVAVLVKGDEKVGIISRGKDFARSDVNLKDGWPTGDRRWDRHIGHDFLGGASCQASKESTDRLNAIL